MSQLHARSSIINHNSDKLLIITAAPAIFYQVYIIELVCEIRLVVRRLFWTRKLDLSLLFPFSNFQSQFSINLLELFTLLWKRWYLIPVSILKSSWFLIPAWPSCNCTGGLRYDTYYVDFCMGSLLLYGVLVCMSSMCGVRWILSQPMLGCPVVLCPLQPEGIISHSSSSSSLLVLVSN